MKKIKIVINNLLNILIIAILKFSINIIKVNYIFNKKIVNLIYLYILLQYQNFEKKYIKIK